MVIIQTICLGKYINSNDLSWTMTEPSIIGQVAVSLSILTACVPSLKGVIEMFWSGASQFVVPTQCTSSHNASRNNGLRSLIPSKFRSNCSSGGTPQDQGHGRSRDQKTESYLKSGDRIAPPNAVIERSESQTNLREGIMRTTEYEVYTEPAVQPSSRKTGSDDVSQDSNEAYGYGRGPGRAL